MSNFKKIAKSQEKYYGDLFDKHGTGVDAVASGKQIYKDLRFKKLSAIFEDDDNFSIHDVGFGVGHYLDYITKKYPRLHIDYSGSEVTKRFVGHCQDKYPDKQFYHRDLSSSSFNEKYDYLVFGGTFYHKVDCSDEEFEAFVFRILKNTFKMSNKGIAFNFITDFVDYKYPDLYYAKLDKISDFVVNNLSRYFKIDHGYPLYEFTVHVFQENHIKQQFEDDEFKKYFK